MRRDGPDATTPDEAPSSEALAGDFAPLSSALGSPDLIAPLADLAQLLDEKRPKSAAAIRGFLTKYRDQLLAAVELPAIQAAYELAAQGKGAELIQLDRDLARRFGTSTFAEASKHTGRTQLRRLRPLRDRNLQRYLAAVDEGKASGWHVVVFGLLLSLFSLPLRQGIAHYAQKTQQTVLDSAAVGVPMSPADRDRLAAEAAEHLVETLKRLLPASVLAAV